MWHKAGKNVLANAWLTSAHVDAGHYGWERGEAFLYPTHPRSIPCSRGRARDLPSMVSTYVLQKLTVASLAQLAEHALRKRMVVGSIPTGGFEHVCGNSSWKLMLRHYCLKSCRELPGATAGVGTGSDIILFGKFVAQQCPCGCKPLRLGMGCATLVPNPRQQVYHAHGA